MALVPMDAICGYEFWRDGCRMMAAATCEVLQYAKEPVTPETIIRFIQSVPRTSDELITDRWQKSYCGTCMEKAHAAMEEPIKRWMMDYFLVYFPERRWLCQETLIDWFIGLLEGVPWESFQCPTKD